MMSKVSFSLRIQENERIRAKNVAQTLGVSENRLYTELIHDGLLVREQMLYMTRLRELAATTDKTAALAILDKAANTPPIPTDL
jgi:phage antirepressor YoqD-like protein